MQWLGKSWNQPLGVRAICVSSSCRFAAGISIHLYFYFTTSASSLPCCTVCQGGVKSFCILWSEIKYHCGSVASWSFLFPWYSCFRDSIKKNRFGELPDMFWGLVRLSLTQQLFLPLYAPQSSISALRTAYKSAVLGITLSMTTKWRFAFCVDPETQQNTPQFVSKMTSK